MQIYTCTCILMQHYAYCRWGIFISIFFVKKDCTTNVTKSTLKNFMQAYAYLWDIMHTVEEGIY